jgi:hypothetical protein
MTGLIDKFFGKKQEKKSDKPKEIQNILSFEEFIKVAKEKIEEIYPKSKVKKCINPEVSEFPCLKLDYKGKSQFFGLYNAYQDT